MVSLNSTGLPKQKRILIKQPLNAENDVNCMAIRTDEYSADAIILNATDVFTVKDNYCDENTARHSPEADH